MNKLSFGILVVAILSSCSSISSEKNISETKNVLSCLSSETGDKNLDGSNAFDFLSGRNWKIKGRKRIGRFINSNEWEEMEGVERSSRIEGVGMLDVITFPKWRPNFELTILRIYDKSTGLWSIYDANGEPEFTPPVVGSFANGLGIFLGDFELNGQELKVRYTWTCDWNHPRYQQEFSNDGGKTWEIDWQMTFSELNEP